MMKTQTNAEKVIWENLINPYFEKEPKYVGVEIELYFFSICQTRLTKEVMCEAFKYLVENHGFKVVTLGSDGCIVRLDNGTDAISCDYCYQLLEFSMGKDVSICNIEKRFHEYYNILMPFFKERGYMFTGMATNHFRLPFDDESQYTHDFFYTKIREYVRKYTTHKDPSYFYTMMASAQSHVDINGKDLLKAYNLFNKLDFVRALLFSNSLPNSSIQQNYVKYPENLLCARDILWDNQGLPNTGLIDEEFHSLDDLVQHIQNLKIYIEANETGINIFEPITLKEYFKDQSKKENGLACFRSFEHVVLNNNHVIEVRSDCTQPLADTFLPIAFNTGIAYNLEETSTIVDKFFEENKINKTNSELRYMAITEQAIVSEEIMKKFLYSIYNAAKKGLESRGGGEEKYIECLLTRIEEGMCPAKKTRELLKNGCSILDVAELYSKI